MQVTIKGKRFSVVNIELDTNDRELVLDLQGGNTLTCEIPKTFELIFNGEVIKQSKQGGVK